MLRSFFLLKESQASLWSSSTFGHSAVMFVCPLQEQGSLQAPIWDRAEREPGGLGMFGGREAEGPPQALPRPRGGPVLQWPGPGL